MTMTKTQQTKFGHFRFYLDVGSQGMYPCKILFHLQPIYSHGYQSKLYTALEI